jgi:hypothetical protein
MCAKIRCATDTSRHQKQNAAGGEFDEFEEFCARCLCTSAAAAATNRLSTNGKNSGENLPPHPLPRQILRLISADFIVNIPDPNLYQSPGHPCDK